MRRRQRRKRRRCNLSSIISSPTARHHRISSALSHPTTLSLGPHALLTLFTLSFPNHDEIGDGSDEWRWIEFAVTGRKGVGSRCEQMSSRRRTRVTWRSCSGWGSIWRRGRTGEFSSSTPPMPYAALPYSGPFRLGCEELKQSGLGIPRSKRGVRDERSWRSACETRCRAGIRRVPGCLRTSSPRGISSLSP